MAQINPKSIPIPKILWDELENALMIKSKDLVYDIAKTLRQDPQILWKEFRSKKSNIFLLDAEQGDEDYECSALVETTKVAHKCKKPTIFGSHYCPEHEFWVLPNSLKQKHHLQRQNTSEGPKFIDCITQDIYNIDYERIGKKHNEKGFVFEIQYDE